MHIGLVDLHWGGHHTPYVSLLARYFTGEGHRVTFVTDERHERLDEIPELDNFTVDTRDFRRTPNDPDDLTASIREQYVRTGQLNRIFELAHGAELDVIHFLYFDRTQIPLRLATLMGEPEIPVVATLHRDAFLSSSGGNLVKRTTQLATTLALSSTLRTGALDVLTVHADSIRNRIIGAVDAATRENTRTVPAPTPDYELDRTPEALRSRLDLPQDRDVILFFGGLRDEKGPDVLAELVRGLDRPLTVVYAGSPVDFTQEDVREWKRRIEGPVEIVDRLEYIPEDEVNAYFAASDALVLPYRRTRGISGPLRRAAAVGTPAIARADSDVGKVIERHELGETFELRNQDSFERALTAVLEKSSDRSSALSKFATSRRWTETGESFLEIYRNVM